MQFRDRVREFRRVPARQLRPNPKNWRTHPSEQQDALRGVLAEIGYAGALLARELADGSLELIDGHLRAETTPDQEVPVLVLDLNQNEADKLLAVHDPLAAMARADGQQLASLLAQVETQNAAVQAMLVDLAQQSGVVDTAALDRAADEVIVPSLFQVVVECRDETEQRTLFDRLKWEGHTCRVLTL